MFINGFAEVECLDASIISLFFHPLQQSGECFEIYRVSVYIEQSAVTVDEFVGRIAVDADETFDGVLLLGGKVVMDDVIALNLVFLDDVLPRLVAGAVGKIEMPFLGFTHPITVTLSPSW